MNNTKNCFYIETLDKIQKNDFLIHLEYGIGQYKGLKKINVKNIENEYLILSCFNNIELFIPVYSIHLLQKYSFDNAINPILIKLFNNNWKKEKQKIADKIYDTALILLDNQAKRASISGYSFKNDVLKYKKFIKKCPFKITTDQNNVIKSVFEDMSKNIPMDRIICGDVGLGKTEIAIRAAFLSFINNKQVAILVPTTLLTQQHLYIFKERFSSFKCKIEHLSRLNTKKKEKQILLQTQTGKINILIGTHKLLFNKVQWNNLGLLIIDEEHRFGVMHKEYLKKNNQNIDVLTLTATPIPRTLNMAFSGVRDLSIINTPPKNRLPIKTFVKQYDINLIKEIILKEIDRGGQVYYIFNKVNSIENKVLKLSNLLPQIKIHMGHGQMHPKELKNIMTNFYEKKFDVLVSTTIIETGIDIPNVNSIIIEGADQFGLSQLHQLRGRVGRSNFQAYAWLLIHDLKKINIKAYQRISAISSCNSLGSGLSLSNRDLEIRGIGELLGEDQSGHIKTIGVSLYTQLLNKTISEIKKNKNVNSSCVFQSPPKIELNVPSIIPNSYIHDPYIRISFYKKLCYSHELSQIDLIQKKLLTDFGKIPKTIKNLIKINKIRIIAEITGFKEIQSYEKGGIFILQDQHNIQLNKFFNIMNKNITKWKIDHNNNKNLLLFDHKINDNIERIKWLLNLMKEIFLNTLLKK
ncbi:DEAD/DEAH box helicase [Buchnera aphidicola (Thelaxes californica)]|uniref:DEAD/DEAH box helicase n=1 Tax=Buchnera aphidicola (Thelaxes californica) TaxID=1315998 RepID=A0A4D6YJP8_9GAMM|nr:DEAD/DEAH box helicase [Buchnera aphidicola]QCI26761.1 DEAD/DEAH box helicase [Buchnera aphidicola (Thelaxes californica)]